MQVPQVSLSFGRTAFLALHLVLLGAIRCADATATIPHRRQFDSQCNTGDILCCDSVQDASSPTVGMILSLIAGPDVCSNPNLFQGSTGKAGLTCSPLSVIGVGGSSCSAQPVCCTNNSFNGVIALGCTPVNLNL
ncbi:fungal hydrophobin-domain-containing protein [Crassisporium funariophilum]|nr:fungal hydrophobin-domain-containing protein [Crassisporium funariophilum]